MQDLKMGDQKDDETLKTLENAASELWCLAGG